MPTPSTTARDASLDARDLAHRAYLARERGDGTEAARLIEQADRSEARAQELHDVAEHYV